MEKQVTQVTIATGTFDTKRLQRKSTLLQQLPDPNLVPDPNISLDWNCRTRNFLRRIWKKICDSTI